MPRRTSLKTIETKIKDLQAKAEALKHVEKPKLVACVGYSVAKHGPLVAYRFDGESELTAYKFVAVWP